MKTGKELDAIVAEKLMGNKRKWHPPSSHNQQYGITRCGECNDLVQKYSSADFMQVQEEMHRRGFWMRVTSPFRRGDPWHVGFTPHGTTGWNGKPDLEASGHTMAEAGCLAALKAVGVEVPHESSV